MSLLEIAALSMKADMDRLNGISTNLANATTPGYKRIVEVHPGFAGALGAADASQLQATQPYRDLATGPVRATERPLDLMVDGGAFLELQTPQGPLYTRGGSFQRDAQGRIGLGENRVLQWVDGDFRTTASEAELRIDGTGQVHVGGEAVGRLRMVRFDNAQQLSYRGDGLYAPGDAHIVEDLAQATVRSGYLEASNVQSTQEMVRLMETSRHFEAMQKLVQGYESVMETAIRKLGEV